MPAISEILSSLSVENRLRAIPPSVNGDMIDMSSNDYLSLAGRCRDFKEEFMTRFPDAGFSSSASRLLSTQQKYHTLLEEYLERLYGKPSLLFNSGYHANVGCVGALSLPSTLFVCDRLVHASIVDGLRMAGSDFKRFPHNDIAKLRAIVEREAPRHERVIIVVESIYSMDGDEAPLEEILALRKQYGNVMVYLDEAHAFGVRGEKGLGIAEELRRMEETDIIIGTFGKAAASAGAFAICSAEMKSFFVNCARPFIFSTAIPPVNAAWSLLMTEKITGMGSERKRLRELSGYFNSRVSEITGSPTGSTSQIVPFITGNAEKAVAIASHLRDNGILALPIRRPTVPPGGERIRFSLSAGMTRQCLDSTCGILQDIYR